MTDQPRDAAGECAAYHSINCECWRRTEPMSDAGVKAARDKLARIIRPYFGSEVCLCTSENDYTCPSHEIADAISAHTEAAVKGRDDWWVARLTAAGFHPGLSVEENVADLTARLAAAEAELDEMRNEWYSPKEWSALVVGIHELRDERDTLKAERGASHLDKLTDRQDRPYP